MGEIEIYSQQGRVLIQVGALDAAEQIFQRAQGEFEGLIEYGSVQRDDCVSLSGGGDESGCSGGGGEGEEDL